MSEVEFIFRPMSTHQVLIILVVDTRVLRCVADSLQERRFASVSPTNYKYTKASICRSEVIGVTVVHDCCKLLVDGRGNNRWQFTITVIHQRNNSLSAAAQLENIASRIHAGNF